MKALSYNSAKLQCYTNIQFILKNGPVSVQLHFAREYTQRNQPATALIGGMV